MCWSVYLYLNLTDRITTVVCKINTDSWIPQLPVIGKIVRPSVYYPFCFGVTASSLGWVQSKFLDFPVSLLRYIVPVMPLWELFDGTVECHVSCRRFYLARLYQWFQQIGKTYILGILFKKQTDSLLDAFFVPYKNIIQWLYYLLVPTSAFYFSQGKYNFLPYFRVTHLYSIFPLRFGFCAQRSA